MKFGVPKKLKWNDRRVYLLIALPFFIYMLPTKFSNVYTIIGAIVIAAFLILGPAGLGVIKGSRKPLFEIKNKTLYYQTWRGSFREYPLSKFGGKIQTDKILFEERLRTPGLRKNRDYLIIGYLDKEEKKRFIEKLKEQVALLKER